MNKIKKFKDFILENFIENTEQYKNDFFDKVQDEMKIILGKHGNEDFIEDIIIQYQNKIKNIIDIMIKDSSITPDIVAKKIVDKYALSTKFNNQDDIPEVNQLNGDRSMNNLTP